MKKTNPISTFLRSKSFPLIIILVVMTVVTAVVSHGRFFAKGNILGILFPMVIQVIMLCGVGLILISGNIDLSVAGQATLCALVFARLCQRTALPWGILIIITLLFACCLGLVNTFLVNKLRFPAFIATIGMSSVYRGLCSVMTNGDNIGISRPGFSTFGQATVLGVLPVSFICAVILLAIFQFILSYTRFGRNIFIVGGNPPAARLAGLNPDRTRMILFIVNSCVACLGGLVWASNAGLASPVAIIDSAPDMQVISAGILGGIAFMGGAGNLVGGLIGVLLLNIFKNMLIVMGIPTYWTVFAQGFVLAVALGIDYVSNERRRKALLAASAAADLAEAEGLST